jgi:hypothetical protein
VAAYPGNYAAPGSMQPGSIWPGDPLSAASDTYAVFTGNETLTYLQYLDVQAGRTLVAVPGGTYDVAVASGYVNVGLLPDDGRWIIQAE